MYVYRSLKLQRFIQTYDAHKTQVGKYFLTMSFNLWSLERILHKTFFFKICIPTSYMFSKCFNVSMTGKRIPKNFWGT